MKKLLLILILPFFACQKTQPQTYEHCDLINGILDSKEVLCGSIQVPENHSEPNGKKIEVSYILLKARNSESKKFPVIYFTGGPGGPAITTGRIRNWANDPFRDDRSIILFDQRGIGYSSPLPNIEEDLLRIMAGDFSYQEELKETINVVNLTKEQCEESNIDVGNYTTFQNANDVGLLMEHFGFEKYNLYGGSYGTRLARVVQDKFPKKVNAVILNSPSPLSGDFLVDRLKNYTKSLNRVFDYCKNDVSCNKEYPDLRDEYLDAIKSLAENPILVNTNAIEFYINDQDGIYLIRRMLYRNDSRSKIPQLIRAFNNREGAILEEIVSYEMGFSGGFNASMMMAIERHEQYNPVYTTSTIEEYYAQADLLPVKLGYFNSLYEACRTWHANILPEDRKEFNKSSVPTLITVNQYDPVTPPENGEILQKQLENSRLFILDEGGHGGGNEACRDKVMIAFMNDPFGELETSCLNIYKK